MNPVGISDELMKPAHRAEVTLAMPSQEHAKALDGTSYILQSPKSAKQLMRSVASLNSAQGTKVMQHA